MEILRINNIQWDADTPDELEGLPKELTLNIDLDGLDEDEREEAISNAVTDATGYCHKGFDIAPELSESELFWQTYKPIVNTVSDTRIVEAQAGKFYGFETTNEDLAFIVGTLEKAPKTVWTMVDGDDGTYILAGAHSVNRICYLVTEVPWESGNESFLDCPYANDETLESSADDNDLSM